MLFSSSQSTVLWLLESLLGFSVVSTIVVDMKSGTVVRSSVVSSSVVLGTVVNGCSVVGGGVGTIQRTRRFWRENIEFACRNSQFVPPKALSVNREWNSQWKWTRKWVGCLQWFFHTSRCHMNNHHMTPLGLVIYEEISWKVRSDDLVLQQSRLRRKEILD